MKFNFKFQLTFLGSCNYVWLKLDKNAFDVDYDIYLCTVNIPPRRTAVCQENDDIFESLTSTLQTCCNKGNLF